MKNLQQHPFTVAIIKFTYSSASWTLLFTIAKKHRIIDKKALMRRKRTSLHNSLIWSHKQRRSFVWQWQQNKSRRYLLHEKVLKACYRCGISSRGFLLLNNHVSNPPFTPRCAARQSMKVNGILISHHEERLMKASNAKLSLD